MPGTHWYSVNDSLLSTLFGVIDDGHVTVQVCHVLQ